ncbi:MAG TPA: hydrogenase maturation protease [Streptosporangiaceae bacterium]|nr:hydrogenase maturation protease [Streptosporangiaceae bacterium]
MTDRVVVIGVGNEFRRDDGVGLRVLESLRPLVPDTVRLVVSDGEPVRLIEEWSDSDLAVVIDAVRAGALGTPAPGRTYRLEIEQVGGEPLAAVSSHGLGLGNAISLARTLDMLPNRLVVHAVEVADCGYGTGLTPAVAGAADTLTTAVLADLGIS